MAYYFLFACGSKVLRSFSVLLFALCEGKKKHKEQHRPDESSLCQLYIFSLERADWIAKSAIQSACSNLQSRYPPNSPPLFGLVVLGVVTTLSPALSPLVISVLTPSVRPVCTS